MGVFTVSIEVGDPAGERFEPVDALVDTAASHTVIPASLLRQLGVEPHDTHPFLLADGRSVQRDVGRTWLKVDGHQEMTIVVFGDNGTTALLGAVTLEEMRPGVYPVGKKLISVPGYLMVAAQ
jgi:predicted aspartyl protease